jgi:hypothetical protein
VIAFAVASQARVEPADPYGKPRWCGEVLARFLENVTMALFSSRIAATGVVIQSAGGQR